MKHQPESKPLRTNIFIMPHTRHRLNRFKADLSLTEGRSISQDDAINILIDHYAKTAPQEFERARELA
jgi:hypothetical protein